MTSFQGERVESSVRGMILAAGFGTRLKAIGRKTPKPMLPVCGIPLIRYALAQMKAAGIHEVVINLHHQGDLIQKTLGDGSTLGMSLMYSLEEPEILGTGGGVRKALRFLGNGPFVVMNGKIVSDLDLGKVLDFHRKSSALATMVVRPDPDARAWGAVELTADGRIARIVGMEAPFAAKTPLQLQGYMFTGIQVLQPEFLASFPEEAFCIVRKAYRSHLESDARLYGYVDRGYWHDHSTLSRYLAGNLNLLARSEPLWPRQGLEALSGVDPRAHLDGSTAVLPPVKICSEARLGPNVTVGPYAVVGSGAVLMEGSLVRNTVVMDHARVEGRFDGFVVSEEEAVKVDLTDEGARCGPRLERGSSRVDDND